MARNHGVSACADEPTPRRPRLAVIIRRIVAAPPRVVFAAYTDPTRLPEWQPGVRRVVGQTGPINQPGTTYALDQPGPRFTVTVLDVAAPHFHRQLESFRWYRWHGTARFDRLADGVTRFSYEYQPRLTGLGWLLAPLVTAMALVFMSREFDLLKDIAERRTPDATDD